MAEKRDGWVPAFPTTGENYGNGGETGMSLRDYFAGQVLASMHIMTPTPASQVAALCYTMADAMLVERAK